MGPFVDVLPSRLTRDATDPAVRRLLCGGSGSLDRPGGQHRDGKQCHQEQGDACDEERGAQAEGAAEHAALGGAPLLAGLHKVQVGCQHQHDPPAQIGTAAL